MKSQVPRRIASLAVCALLFASLAFAGFAGTETYLAAIGNPQGAGGAQFFSDVWVTDVSGAPVSFTFQFLQAGQANLSPASFSDTLSPGQTKRYTDVVGTQLHLTNVNGAARILSTGEIFVSERIYNQPAALPLAQTAGQFFSGIPKGFSIGLGQSATLQGVYLGSGLDFRYNYVLLETSGSACTVHVQALDDLGTQLGATDVPLLPYEHLLLSGNAVAPAASTSNARLAATVTAGSGTVLFAGSQVGNAGPQDQSGFEMSFRDALLGSAGVTSLNGLTGAVTLSAGSNVTFGGSGNNIIINASGGGGGGLSAVSHDGTLSGDGAGSPLGVALPLVLSGGSGFLVSVLNSSSASGGAAIDAESTSSSAGAFNAAVRGNNHGTGANGIGVWGQQQGSGWGVYGSVAGPGAGVLGVSASAGFGVVGQAANSVPPNPSAVLAGSIGVFGTSSDGIGVFGASGSLTKGKSYGVHGEGVLGVSGVGTLQLNNSGTNISYGVEGDSYLTGDLRVGVFGYASGGTQNYAGYFFGNVNINGTTHTSGTAIVMDDPTDPENRYLYQSSVQSSDMKNIYDGLAVLDGLGEAVIELPSWLVALNRDYRYQLTCVGGYSPVWIEQEVQGGTFKIKGEKPGQKVSWQLTGIRQDAWANAHRIAVEVDKPEAERGTLHHPEVLGLPAEKSLEWRINPQIGLAVQKQREIAAAAGEESGK